MSLYLIGWRVGLSLKTALGERGSERGGGERKSERNLLPTLRLNRRFESIIVETPHSCLYSDMMIPSRPSIH